MAEEQKREVLVEVKNLEVTYGSGRKAYKAVSNANFTIYKGETFGLVGESGSGKTTIGRAIMRILPTSGGEILYKGQKINGKISHWCCTWMLPPAPPTPSCIICRRPCSTSCRS